MEVETPILCKTPNIDANIEAMSFSLDGLELFLQTSPEPAMKKLLASGTGSIFQISRAFRLGESGRLHNMEFTIIEWYRIEMTHIQLMEEVNDLVDQILHCGKAKKKTYSQAMLEYADININMPAEQLFSLILNKGFSPPENLNPYDKNECLDFIFTQKIQRELIKEGPVFIFDYPSSQAAFARIDATGHYAHRFELYINGIELCNGFYELIDPDEYLRRYKEINANRLLQGKTALPIDIQLINALKNGFPVCSGVALGFDRLVMLAVGATSIEDVMALPLKLPNPCF